MSTSHSFIAKLDHLSIIQVTGEQRHEYLHGQLTVATQTFEPGRAKQAAHCDFKGKMFSALTVSDYQDSFLLSAQHEAAQESVLQLKKYGVFSKVEINISDDLYAVGVHGQTHIDELKVLFADLTDQHLSTCANKFGQAICFNDNSLRYLCYLSETGISRLQDISDDEGFSGSSYWESLEIQAGIANVQGPTVGEFVPQMLNFQAIDAIDFNKGCYMGQEVVARTKFLGKNKRASFILSAADSQLPDTAVVGSNIEVQLGENWRRGGVINRICAVDGQVLALCVMANDTAIGSMVRFKDSNVELTVQALPYSINE